MEDLQTELNQESVENKKWFSDCFQSFLDFLVLFL
jgi:hypothetical protein